MLLILIAESDFFLREKNREIDKTPLYRRTQLSMEDASEDAESIMIRLKLMGFTPAHITRCTEEIVSIPVRGGLFSVMSGTVQVGILGGVPGLDRTIRYVIQNQANITQPTVGPPLGTCSNT